MMKKINICFFCGNLSRGGGTENITKIIANALINKEKYNIYIIDITNKKKEIFFDFDNRINIIHIKQYSVFPIIRKSISLYRCLKKNNIDILINVDIMLIIYSFFACKLTKTKIICWEQFNYFNDIGSKNTHKIRQLCLKYTDYYLNLTKQDLNIFKENFDIRVPIDYIYNPIEKINNYKTYNENSRYLLTAGNFCKDKGFDYCVQVGDLVFSKYPDWKWIFCGDGNEFENIKELVNKSKYKSNYILTGRVKNLDVFYFKSSIYISCSKTEGFGLTLIEAQNFMLPCIAFNVPFGPAEIITNNKNGYLIEPFDVREMADKILYLIENKEKRIEFSSFSRYDFKKFSLNCVINKWEMIIDYLTK